MNAWHFSIIGGTFQAAPKVYTYACNNDCAGDYELRDYCNNRNHPETLFNRN